MAAQALAHWESGLFDCFEDASTCCYGFWCCPCLACTVSGKFGENRCLPLCDIWSKAAVTAFGLPLCVPPAVLALRVAMRNRYGIKGSICKDIAVSCCCEWSSWCQMHREIKHHKKTLTVNALQHQTIMQIQPAPVMMAPAYTGATYAPAYAGAVYAPAYGAPAYAGAVYAPAYGAPAYAEANAGATAPAYAPPACSVSNPEVITKSY